MARAARSRWWRNTPRILVLLDVNMPQTNGFELYKRLIDQEYDIPVIFVTAKGELDERLHGLKMGADDYITKPFQPAELLARVEAVLRRYRKAAPGGVQVVRGGGFEILRLGAAGHLARRA